MNDADHFLSTIDPSMADLARELKALPIATAAYADAAPDLIKAADNASRISATVVDQQRNLDRFLVSTIGLADMGNDVLSANAASLATTLRLLLPTTALTNEYSPGLRCGLQSMLTISQGPPLEFPGVVNLVGLVLGRERYRYPENLPRVGATGGPHCGDMSLPVVPMGTAPPLLVMDDGADPTQYGNQGILLNSDGLKQMLFGPLQGPPRNSAQIGMPG
jgi:ABC-type transporter Mla subunit MlaD